MKTVSFTQQVWVYFLIDRTGEMGKRIDLIERQLHTLVDEMNRDTKMQEGILMSVIVMDAAPARGIRPEREQFKLNTPSGCDLGAALQQLEDLRQTSQENIKKLEIFVWLNSEPAGDWRKRIERLKQQEAQITVFAFSEKAKIHEDILKKISTAPSPPLPADRFNAEHTRSHFKVILSRLKQAIGSSEPEVPDRDPLAIYVPVVKAAMPPKTEVKPLSQKKPVAKAEKPSHKEVTPTPQVKPAIPPEESSQAKVKSPPQTNVIVKPKEPSPVEAKPTPQVKTVTNPEKQSAVITEPASFVEPEVEIKGPFEADISPTPQDQPEDKDKKALNMNIQPNSQMKPDTKNEEQSTAAAQALSQSEPDTKEGEVSETQTPLSSQSKTDGIEDEKQSETAVEPADSPEPPPIKEGGVATIWKEVEPSPELGDPVLHTDVKTLTTQGNWQMIGASRRGKMHAHKGIFREDGFALGEIDGWNLMVVADGGGSCPLSRVGSQLAADTAITAMKRWIGLLKDAPAEETCQEALRHGLEDAYKALEAEAQKREIPLSHLGTTFLSVLHRQSEQGDIVGVLQVGDGLVAAEMSEVDGEKEIKTLAEPDVGATASVTLFLTSKSWKEWVDRAQVQVLETPVEILMAMCDGVADDFIPFDKYLPTLFDNLEKVIGQEHPENALLQLLGYEKRGSFDDRTLAMLYQAKSQPHRHEEIGEQAEQAKE